MFDLSKYRPALLLSVMAVMLPACGGLPSSHKQDEPTLTLYESDPDSLSGSYQKEEIRIRFVSTMHGDESILVIDTDQGELIRRRSSATHHEVSLYGGRATVTISLHSSEDIAANQANISGDESLWQTFLDSRGVTAIPSLSAALGDAGIQGDTHPASQPLHFLAIAATRERSTLRVEGSVPREQLDTYQNMRRLTVPEGQTHHLTCELPEDEGCYGMCGLGCMCWPWICGDCCYHEGCAAHDRACRSWLGFSHPLCGGLVVGLPWIVWWVTARC